MINKDGSITINEWAKGIEESAYIGNADIRFCDTDSYGSLQRGRKFKADDTSSVITGKIVEFEKVESDFFDLAGIDDTQGFYTRLLSDGKWKKQAGYSQNGRGGGLCYWKDYLFIFKDSPLSEVTRIDLYGPLSNTASLAFTTDWQSLSSTKNYKVASVVSNNNILYMGYGNIVASLDEVAGKTFNPSDPTTYDFNQENLVLPDNYIISNIDELSELIMVGANSNSGQSAKVFPWDGLSLESETPIKVTGGKIAQMTTWLGNLFIRVGNYGDVYQYSGSSFSLVKKIPRTLGNAPLISTINEDSRNGMTAYDDKLVFVSGVETETLGVIFSLNSNNVLKIDYKSSTNIIDASGSLPGIYMGALFADYRTQHNDLLLGYEKADVTSSYGIDIIDNSSGYYSDYDPNFVSQLYRVGTPIIKKTFHEVDFVLAEDIKYGDVIKLEYRTTTNGNWITGAELTYTDQGAVSYYTAPSSIASDLTNIQFRVSLDGSPKLLEIIIK